MEHIGPFQMFSAIHPAWLHRRHEWKLDVTPADLDSIEAHCPLELEDPLFADIVPDKRQASSAAVQDASRLLSERFRGCGVRKEKSRTK